jgi:hypothetical protein
MQYSGTPVDILLLLPLVCVSGREIIRMSASALGLKMGAVTTVTSSDEAAVWLGLG